MGQRYFGVPFYTKGIRHIIVSGIGFYPCSYVTCSMHGVLTQLLDALSGNHVNRRLSLSLVVSLVRFHQDDTA